MSITNISDEDLAKMSYEQLNDAIKKEEVPAQEEQETSEEVVEQVDTTSETNKDTDADDVTIDTPQDKAPEDVSVEDASVKEEKKEPVTPAVPSSGSESKDTPQDKPAEQSVEPPNYEEFYKQVMTPFKANGKTVELRTPEEAIRLMQLGAGYGRKLHSIQPHLKTIKMLENHDLLDENKLSYLIDLNLKNPEAIKKLVKESGIDPLDFTSEDPVNYTPVNRSVSSSSIQFEDYVNELKTSNEGIQTLTTIRDQWDNDSIDSLGTSPGIVNIIHEHRKLGFYDRVVNEIERRKILGYLPQGTRFLDAYFDIGQEMVNAGKQPTPTQAASVMQQQPQQPVVLATKAAPSKPTVQNSDKVKAAAATTSLSRKAPAKVNPYDMSDAELLKHLM